ncbi:hypothetical protein DFQ28_009505 [Apophysomyces sp. BC1034]|nr:hypothetical protein DFQ28_009505 [Apophysomyces sp. BC1034]
MFEDDEEDLELLRQYEDNSTNGDGHSSEEIDSDLEERLWSIAQYGTPTAGRKKKSADAKTPAAQSQLSSSDEDESDDDEDSSDEDEDEKESEGSDEESEDDKVVVNGLDSLPVTRVVDLDLDQQKKYMDEEEEDEEEYILNNQLQTLIDEQIQYVEKTKRRNRRFRPKVCFTCQQVGHERMDCDEGLPIAPYECTNEPEDGPCRRCGINSHHTLYCPSVLLSYEKSGEAQRDVTPYCYNCAKRGHFGDECPRLPGYKRYIPSVFSIQNVSKVNKHDSKKNMKSSASSFSRFNESQKKQKRRSDSSNEGNRYGNKNDTPKKKGRTDNEDRRQQDQIRRQLGRDIGSNRSPSNPRYQESQPVARGNNNWRALGGGLPQPTRSGTVCVSRGGGGGGRQSRYQNDFPRGSVDELPKPSSSGVIDISSLSSSMPTRRAPRYRGGYSGGR